jgi:hypothetical protein
LVDLQERLDGVLRLMLASSRRWLLTIDADWEHYVQFLAGENGVLVAECVSNEFLEGDARLSEEAEELLPELGWGWPAPPNQPNWVTVEEGEHIALDGSVLALQTLRRVLGCADDDVVQVNPFRSSTVVGA